MHLDEFLMVANIDRWVFGEISSGVNLEYSRNNSISRSATKTMICLLASK